MLITKRDIEILEFVNDFGFCDVDQLMKRFKVKKTRMYQIMQRLIEEGFIKHERVLYKFSGVFMVTTKGAKYTDLPAIDHISLAQYLHQHTIVNVYLKLREQYPETFWTSERRLKRDKYFDGLGKRGHLSDGIIHFPDGRKIAIEVEMSVKGKNRIEKILKTYRTQIEIKEVWYFCVPSVMSVLKSLTLKMPFVKLYELKEFIGNE